MGCKMFISKLATNPVTQKLGLKHILLDTEQQVAVGYFYEERPARIAVWALNMNVVSMRQALEQLIQLWNES
jgi:hypothetical protein